MKTISEEFQAHLESGATTLCWCWKLSRRDGTVLGFTDHDCDVSSGGVSFRAASGFSASEVQSSLGLSVDNLSVAGALSADALRERDLSAGLYDDAQIEIWRVNWADPAQRVLMRKGNLGEVTRGRSAFEAEMRGLAHRLNQPTGRAYLRNCDAVLGDARCGVALGGSPFSAAGAVHSVLTEQRLFTVTGLGAFESGWFTGGRLLWTTGDNLTHAMEVKSHGRSGTHVTIELWQAMSGIVAPGDLFSLTAGCDKRFETCRSKFANGANFRGFPYIPGNDAVVAYPNRSDGNLDGGSRYGH